MKSASRSRRLAVLTLLTLFSLVVPVQFAYAGVSIAPDTSNLAAPLAATFDVTNTADAGPGSLRAAIEAANATAEADTITFSVTGTITLATALPSISEDLTITGPGAASLTINGGGANRIFYVQTGTTVDISGVTLTGGNATRGSAIYNFGTLSVTDSVLTGNVATEAGGAIANVGSLTLTDVVLSFNAAPTGGAIHNSSSGSITMSGSTVDNNEATESTGGGIMNTAALTITTSTFSYNEALLGGGGGIHNVGANVSVTASLFDHNESLWGGGIASNGTVTVANTTFSHNTVDNNGGGIANNGTVTVTNVTFTGGYAGASGGLYNGATGTATVTNSIFVDIDSLENCQGTLINGGGNLSDDGWCIFEPERMYVDARIDPNLADNGGPTLTHALLTGSPALGGGNAAACAAPPVSGVDQRGFARPNPGGEACDSGAFESSIPMPSTQTFTVNSLNDPGDGVCDVTECTLREAIAAANANIGMSDTITFSVTGTINLTADLPDITDPVTITGPGAASLAINGASSHQPFAITSVVNVSINALTIQNGYSSTSGGGISNTGVLTISDVTIEDSTAVNGGGGLHNTGMVTIANVTFDGNSAAYGGGISSVGSANITISGSRFLGNSALGGNGGGIFSGATLSITETTFTGNSASTGGGGVHNAATATVTKSTFNGNTALYGGALNNGGTLTAGNVTLSGNTVTQGGGGIHNGASANLYNATLHGNSAGGGSGVYSTGATAVVTLTNTILADSTSENCVMNGGGTVVDGGNNLSDDTTCGLAGDGIDPMVNTTLADNGGPTFTHALLANSPALGAGNPAVCAAAPVNGVDQRNEIRPAPAGEPCDSGAFESSNTALAVFDFSAATYSAAENAANPTVRINRSRGVSTATSVQITFTDGPAPEATGGTGSSRDYTNTPITVNFTGGQTFADVTIPLYDDGLIEDDENFTMTLANPAANGLIGTTHPTAVFTILDDDEAGVTVDPTTVAVTEGGPAANVEIVLDAQPTSGTVTITATPGGQCNLGADAGNPVNHDFTGANWDTPWVIPVTAFNDTVVEGAHTCAIVTAITASGAPEYPTGMDVSDITANITDNDTATLVFTTDTDTVGEGDGNHVTTVTLTTVPTGATLGVEVGFAVTRANDTTSAADFAGATIVAGPFVVGDGNGDTRTVTTPIFDDDIPELDETFTLTLVGITGPATAGTPSVQTVTIDDNEPVPPGPMLIAPANGGVTDDTTPTFEWSEDEATDSYQIEIDTDPAFGSPLQAETVAGPTYTAAPPLAEYTTYYWRVRVLTAGGMLGDWSETWAVTVDPSRPDAPILRSPRNRTITADTTPRFTWKGVRGAALYTIQVDDDPGFGSPENIGTGTNTRPNYVVPDPPALEYGVYYWRVQAQDRYGRLSDWSTPFSFELTVHRLPKNGDFTTNSQPVFRWKSVPGAVAYEFQLDGPTPETYTGPDIKFKPAAPLTEGQYTWQVRVDYGGSTFSEWMPAWVVTITPPPSPKVNLIAPANLLVTDDNAPVFNWELLAGGPFTYQIQIDDDRNFRSPVQDFETGADEDTYPADPLADGKYYWRVRAINNVGVAGNWSRVWAFTVDTTAPDAPILRLPAHLSATPDTTPRFVWQRSKTATEYDLVVSTNADLAAAGDWVIDAPGLRGNAYTVPNADALAPDMTYYWGVRARDKVGNQSDWSAPWTFNVLSTVVLPEAPTLVAPAHRTLTNDPAPEFEWAAPATGGPFAYHVQIDDNRNFKSPEREDLDVADVTLTPTDLPDGNYFWRVRAVDGDDVAGAWSAVWRVTIDTTPPAVPVLNNPKDGSGTADSTPRYTWRGVPGAVSYHIQIANDAGFAPGAIEAEDPSVSGRAFVQPTPLDFGTYYWRVQATDGAGNISEWSAANRFDVSILIAPKDGSSSTNSRPVFRWKSVPGAVDYCLQIDDDPAFGSPLVDEIDLTATRYRHPTDMMDGTYYWHVGVNMGLGCDDWMEVWSTTITPKPPQRPKPVAPDNNVFLNTDTPLFVWTDVFNAVQYEIQIDDDGNFSSPVYGAIVDATLAQHSPTTGLPEGKLFWRVRGINSVGVPGAWSARRALTVDITPPDAPTMTGPADGTRVTNRLLRLEWARVSDAVAYQVQLDTTCPPVPGYFPLPPIDVGNKIFYKSPTPLAQNTYCWRVQSFDKAGNASGWSDVWEFALVAGNTDVTAPIAPAQLPFVESFAANTAWLADGGAWTYLPDGAWNGAGWFADTALRGAVSTLTSAAPIDLTAALNPQLVMWQKANVETGDVFTVEVSVDGGVSWSQVEQQTAIAEDWVQRTVDLSAYKGHLVYLRFVLYTQASALSDPAATGIWLDELTIMDVPPAPAVEPTVTPAVEPTLAPDTPIPTEEPVILPPTEEALPEPIEDPAPTPTPGVTPEPTETPGDTPDETLPEVITTPEEPTPGDPPEQPVPSEEPTEPAPEPDGLEQPAESPGEEQAG